MPETIASRPTEKLALVFQEIFTAIVRIRANRQAVSDAESFRAHIREAVRLADQEGRKRGYAPEDIRVALFAVIAFLDESVLNSRNRLFADWPRRPMQEEFFGGHVAGETFFQNLQKLLTANDSETLADVLEVYHLCLLLGYLGRYSMGGQGDLRGIRESVAEKIRRIRGYRPELSPDWKPPSGNAVRAQSDPWAKWLLYGAVACLLLMIVSFVVYKISLNGQVSEIGTLANAGK